MARVIHVKGHGKRCMGSKGKFVKNSVCGLGKKGKKGKR